MRMAIVLIKVFINYHLELCSLTIKGQSNYFDTFLSHPRLLKQLTQSNVGKKRDKKLKQTSRVKKYPFTKTRLFKYIENFTTKNKKFSDKNSDIFHISAQNMDCGCSLEPPRRGGSNEYPQSMFLSRNKKNNVYPCKPHFYCIKMGFKGSKLYRHVFVMPSPSRARPVPLPSYYVYSIYYTLSSISSRTSFDCPVLIS